MSMNRTARATGAAYLGLAIFGMLGFLVVRPMLVDATDPASTLAHLADRPGLASALVGLELLIVISQALAAVGFYRLFRAVGPTAAFATAGFGLVNAGAIMMSGAFLATANAVAADASLAPGGDQAGSVGLLVELSTHAWGVGNVFFGLWLLPMAWVALARGRFPRFLGHFLVAGGVGYVLAGLIGYGVDGAPGWLVDTLPLAATVAELWMVCYLLSKGLRPDTHPAVGAAQA